MLLTHLLRRCLGRRCPSRTRGQCGWSSACEVLEVRQVPSAVAVGWERLAANQAATVARPRLLKSEITVANLTEQDGTPDNKSLLMVPFSGPVEVVDASRITLKFTTSGKGVAQPGAKSISILSVSVDPDDASQLRITTGQLVPRRAQLKIARGALTDSLDRVLGSTSTSLKQGISETDFLMASRPFRPKDINLFTKDAFPSASTAPLSGSGRILTEQTAYTELRSLLRLRLSRGTIDRAEYQRLLDLYSAENTKQTVPDPTMRAALLSLGGTVASGAIDTVLSGENESGRIFQRVDFDPTLMVSVAGSFPAPNGTEGRIIKFNENLRRTRFEAIGAVIAHEVAHDDATNSRNEEVLIDLVRILVWAQVIRERPRLAKINDLGVRSNNTLLLALLNSGNAAYPRLGVTRAPQIQRDSMQRESHVFVGGSEGFLSFDNYVRTAAVLGGIPDIDTPGNPYLEDFVARATGLSGVGASFSRTTRDFLDAHQQVLSNTQALQLARILRLTTP